ncbi:MAG: tetratricopeptide repeat-containing protein [Desulfovibrio sp.]|jgi:tetratricopeptide (TPR) repeat protein|nr:tetratricopeptide repeat-containing protein [Desulfovibrio sp.]
MKQKIEWYKEVLELEPGSKVFFPLAKLLAADKQAAEAEAVLRQGLLRHPDHVEARLLLVELLYRRGVDEELSAQTETLARLFSAYPGFWSAWCESFAEDPRMRDAATALRFFVAGLQGKEIDWSGIVEQGLQAVLREAGAPDADAFESGLSEEAPVLRSMRRAAVDCSGSDAAAGVPACEGETRALLSPPEQAQDEDAGAVDEGEEADESISLRTRSMAEVLAEQGDYAGALDIYRELLQAAPAGDRPSLEARVEELSRCMSQAADSAGREEKTPPFAGESSKIVNLFESLSFVESLAERLEARAR